MPIKRINGRTTQYKGRSRQARPGTSRALRTQEQDQEVTPSDKVAWTAKPPAKETSRPSAQASARAARDLLDKKAAARAAARTSTT
ncbi:hypothetical protein K8Q93_00375 [Candidatus Parcubacteria bacterium]|nr:hypothetical protein [Candidatus Parcubacteria bacterium]